MSAPTFQVINEQERTYYYADGSSFTLKGVESINVSASGTHRINTTDGGKHIVAPGWQRISFVADNWTF